MVVDVGGNVGKELAHDGIGLPVKNDQEMSQQLSNALDSLQAANEQLQQDIEREREQEKQRVDFFTSVSHELKTPIAIIKGQLEGMIHQVGPYKDRDTYLRRCPGIGALLLKVQRGGRSPIC